MRFRNVFSCVIVAPVLIGAAEPVHLQPSSQWVLDYAANSCRLVRHFGEGKDATVLAFESEAPGAMDMFVSGKPLSTSMDQVPAKFMPLQAKPMLGQTARTTDNGDPVVLWSSTVRLMPDAAAAAEEQKEAERKAHPEIRPAPISLAEQAAKRGQRQAFAAATTAIEIDASKRHPVVLDTGSLGDAIKMFDQCSRDSLRDWGIDPDLEDKLVRPAWAPNPAAWFSSSDYPPNMTFTGEESVVKVRLLVDATGRVTKCTSLSHYKAPEFGDVVCSKFMRRAHFEPAELADGTKVPSYYVNRIVFRMER